jgi:ABC-2 type transport system permease protein
MLGFDPVLSSIANWGVPSSIVNSIASLSLLRHFDAMRRGMIDFADIGYYIGIIAFMLASAKVVTDNRKAS